MREDAIADAAFHDPWVRTPSQILITEHIIKKTDYMSTWYEYMTCPSIAKGLVVTPLI